MAIWAHPFEPRRARLVTDRHASRSPRVVAARNRAVLSFVVVWRRRSPSRSASPAARRTYTGPASVKGGLVDGDAEERRQGAAQGTARAVLKGNHHIARAAQDHLEQQRRRPLRGSGPKAGWRQPRRVRPAAATVDPARRPLRGRARYPAVGPAADRRHRPSFRWPRERRARYRAQRRGDGRNRRQGQVQWQSGGTLCRLAATGSRSQPRATNALHLINAFRDHWSSFEGGRSIKALATNGPPPS